MTVAQSMTEPKNTVQVQVHKYLLCLFQILRLIINLPLGVFLAQRVLSFPRVRWPQSLPVPALLVKIPLPPVPVDYRIYVYRKYTPLDYIWVY